MRSDQGGGRESVRQEDDWELDGSVT